MVDAPLRPPAMADVARLAGVSHQTVARVLGGHPQVRAATRFRVRRMIAELGYRRNFSARALATRRTRALGLVATDTTRYGPATRKPGRPDGRRRSRRPAPMRRSRSIRLPLDRIDAHAAATPSSLVIEPQLIVRSSSTTELAAPP